MELANTNGIIISCDLSNEGVNPSLISHVTIILFICVQIHCDFIQ